MNLRSTGLLLISFPWLVHCTAENREYDPAVGGASSSSGGTGGASNLGGSSAVDSGSDGGASAGGGSAGAGGAGATAFDAVFDHYSFVRGKKTYSISAASGLLENDSVPAGAGAVVIAESIGTTRGGIVTVEADGSFVYSPASEAFWGDDMFEYRLEHGGASATAEVRVSVQVNSVVPGELLEGLGNGFVIDGVDPGDQAGRVASAGDVNGDGLDDIIVGAPGADPGGNESAGTAYVVFGKAGQAAVKLQAIEQGIGDGFPILGVAEGDGTGVSVATAGDVNGDGFSDLIIGAVEQTAVPEDAGRAYVVFGKGSKAPVDLADVAGELGGGFVIYGAESGDSAGISVSSAGDVNGDGLSDVIVGANRAEDGAAYVVFGKKDSAGVSLSAIELDNGMGFVMRGGTGVSVGRHVASAGDVNGDGLDDVAVGAPEGGKAYVVLGRVTSSAVDLAEIEAGDGGGFAISGSAEGSAMANTWAVASAGDVNGDGLVDVMLGKPSAGPDTKGRAYTFFGKAGFEPIQLVDIDSGSDEGYAIVGAEPSDGAGLSVSGGGDVNGDGLPDSVIGSTASGSSSYVVFGRQDPGELDLLAIEEGSGEGLVISGLGSAKLVGDVNGDGLEDLAVGDSLADGWGRAYVFFSWDMSEAMGARHGTLRGTSLDDVLVYTPEAISIFGGHGFDTLALSSGGQTLDLTTIRTAAIRSIEAIDLTGDGDNRLIVEDRHIRRLPSSRTDAPGGLAKTLVVLGDAGDEIVVDLSKFEQVTTNAGRAVYKRLGASYGIEISPSISISDSE